MFRLFGLLLIGFVFLGASSNVVSAFTFGSINQMSDKEICTKALNWNGTELKKSARNGTLVFSKVFFKRFK